MHQAASAYLPHPCLAAHTLARVPSCCARGLRKRPGCAFQVARLGCEQRPPHAVEEPRYMRRKLEPVLEACLPDMQAAAQAMANFDAM